MVEFRVKLHHLWVENAMAGIVGWISWGLAGGLKVWLAEAEYMYLFFSSFWQ
jgi:hypothetical protein